jgi:predicted TIM-barrel fold metal-dependent hydrolase
MVPVNLNSVRFSDLPGDCLMVSAIDVHVHYLPEIYKQQTLKLRTDGTNFPNWDVDSHLAVMDRMNIATAMLSISSPHVHFSDDPNGRTLARAVNESAAEIVAKHPDRFGLLSSLPLHDVEGSLSEIAYAIDVLHADGIKVPSNCCGIYLGDERLEPVFAELNRRRAVIVIHPTKPSAVPRDVLAGYNTSMLEFLFDTTRAVANMIMNRTLERHTAVQVVVPHAGSFLPVLVDRLKGRPKGALVSAAPVTAQFEGGPDVDGVLRRLYYDLAGYPVPGQLAALLYVASADHLLYGSDWPYTQEARAHSLQERLLTTDLLTDEQRQAVFRDNALRLFPRLAARAEQPVGR